MNNSEIIIRDIKHEDLDAISRIHRASFDDRALTQLGQGAVKRYYHWLMIGFAEVYPICATTVYGKLAGFCFAGVYAGSFSGFLRKNKWYLTLNILLRPWLVFNPLIWEQAKLALKTIKRIMKHQDRNYGDNRNDSLEKIKKGSHFGILSIAVDPGFQRKGVADLMMREVERGAIENGYSQLNLSVHPENLPAVKFYEKLGWEKNLPNGRWDGKMFKKLESK